VRREAKWCVMGLALAVLTACQTSGYATLNEGDLQIAPMVDLQIAPMVERRDTLTATGYSVIDVQTSEYPAQRRLLAIRAAKLDAYRALTEQVYGQYIDATTTVAEMVVRSDTFRSRVEGVIYGATLVQIEPRGGDTYEVTLALDKSIVNDLRILYLDSISIAKG
jgi:outer membrane protein FlgP